MSNKHKSSIVGAAGFLAAFNHNLFTAAQQAGVSEERLYDLLNNDAGFAARLVKLFVESAKANVQSLAEMIAACGFRYVGPDVTANFPEANSPITGPVANVADMLTVTLEDLGAQKMTTAEVETAITQKGYRSATLAELLAYAKATWNGKDSILALGSSWMDRVGDRHIMFLHKDDKGRALYCYSIPPTEIECPWQGDSPFLVVRK